MVYSGADAKRAGRTMKLKARVGEILFARRYLSCEIVVHETTHIALYMARRLGITPADDGQCVAGYLSRGSGNERFSYLLGTLANSVVRGLRRHGLIGEDSDAAPRLRHA